MAEGFASGFQKGFGLVNSFYDRQSQDEYRQGLLAQRKEEAEATAQFRENQLKANAEFRTKELEEQRRRNLVLEGEARASREAREQAAIRDDEYQTARMGLLGAQQEALQEERAYERTVRERENRRYERNQQTQQAALAASELMETLEGIERGDINYNTEQLLQTLEKPTGSLFDVGIAIDPETFATQEGLAKQVQSLQQNGKVEGSAVLKAMNLMLNQTNSYGVGETIDETYQNAPEWMRNGEYTIASKEFIDVRMNQASSDGQSGPSLSGKILVTAKDRKGNEVMYVAPATEGREGTGAQVSLDTGELLQGFAGYMTYANAMRQYAPRIKRLKAEALFTDARGNYDAAAYSNAVSSVKSAYAKDVKDRSRMTAPSPVSGMTNEAFIGDDRRFTEWAEHRILFPNRGMESRADALQQHLGLIRSADKIKDAEDQHRRLTGKPLDQEKLLEAQGFLDEKNGEVVVTDEDAYYEWRDSLGITRKPSRFTNPNQGMDTRTSGLLYR